LGIDLLSIAGHKLYAPKGVGVLYIRKGVQIQPFILGAGHEMGKRAGTENVIEIVGLGKACEIFGKNMVKNSVRIQKLRDYLYQGLLDAGLKLKLNGHPEKRLPNTLNISFLGVDSHELLNKIPFLAASTGSACHAHTKEPSGVLTAMGIKPEIAFGAVRFSLGLGTKKEEIDRIIKAITKILPNIKY
jgi:cysteine desulfurase